MTDKTKNLVVRTITGIIYVAIMVVSFLRADVMILLFAAIAGMTVWEYTGLVNNYAKDVTVNRFINTVAAVYLVIAVGFNRMQFTSIADGFVIFVPYVLTMVYLFISELYAKNENPINNVAYSMLAQMYVAMPLSLISVAAIGTSPDGPTYDMLIPLSIFIFLWCNDSGAYCFGSLLGKHKLFPRISPGKTWEGSIGGGLLVLVVAIGLGIWANGRGQGSQLNVVQWAGFGLVVTFFGTWGDLVESLFKRKLGIKDSGNILPGHGGMLDRFDSSLLAIPASVVYLYSLVLL